MNVYAAVAGRQGDTQPGLSHDDPACGAGAARPQPSATAGVSVHLSWVASLRCTNVLRAVAPSTRSAARVGRARRSPLHAYAHLGQRKAHPRTQPRSCPTCTPASALVTGSTSCRSRAATASAACCRRSSLAAPPVPPAPTPSRPRSMPLAPSPGPKAARSAFVCKWSQAGKVQKASGHSGERRTRLTA